jgi:tetratricopeptide (TPR) repeat protein
LRIRAAHDPLEARVAVSLMRALVASGDRLAALQHARIYETLVEEELSLPPDREVVRYAAELRRAQTAEAAEPAVATAVVAPAELAPAELAPPDPAQPASLTTDPQPAGEPRGPFWFPSAEFQIEPRQSRATAELPASLRQERPSINRHRAVAMVAAAGIIAIAALGALAVRRARVTPEPSARTIAVGRITDYRGSEPAAIAGSVTDLLATNLGRASGVRVVSTARMYDLLRRVGNAGDSTSGAFAAAAQQAGADELVDGALYDHSGRLRLDLRRIDLPSGAVRAAYSVEAPDVFSLADSGTARIVAGLGIATLPGSVADVTTRSATAYRMYEQGLRAHFRGDVAVARNFFEAAVAEDSLFALAQYYAAVDAGNLVVERQRLERARQLASRASERERLTIMAGWANTMDLPSLRAIAETLATRYPAEVAGHLYAGIALVEEGRHLEALTPLERVIAMDSLGLHRVTAGCGACDAFRWMVGAYQLADSLPAAERVARRWLRLQSESRLATEVLIDVLDAEGRGVAADSMLRAVSPRLIERKDALNRRAAYLIRAGNYDAAEQLLADVVASGGEHDRIDAYWMLAIALRQQGRFAAARDTARRMRALGSTAGPVVPGTAPGIASLEAQILLERGQPREAAALFDSIARGREQVESGSTAARRQTWNLAHSASARAAAGDTAAVERLIDSVQSLGAASGFGRDVQMHHFVRGLLFAARHDDERAVKEFQQSIVSRNFGHTRANYELGRALMRLGRPAEAIAAVQPALRGSLEASNLYVSRTELHELLAQAWDAANGRDSAVAHYRVVAESWKGADPVLQPRRARAEERLSALSPRR